MPTQPTADTARRRARMYGWWYVCIGVGFTLLGIRSVAAGGKLWMNILRFVIAAGFFILGGETLRQSARGRAERQ